MNKRRWMLANGLFSFNRKYITHTWVALEKQPTKLSQILQTVRNDSGSINMQKQFEDI